jgi:hypothetical protein
MIAFAVPLPMVWPGALRIVAVTVQSPGFRAMERDPPARLCRAILPPGPSHTTLKLKVAAKASDTAALAAALPRGRVTTRVP